MSVSTCQTNIPVKRLSCEQLATDYFRSDYLKTGVPLIIENYLQKLPCSKWNMDYLIKTVGCNNVEVRGRTNQQDYKTGKSYIVRTTTVGEYIDELKTKTKRSLSSYMAVQNIRRCFPQLQDECVLPKYIEKIHNGPFLWVAHEGHYEYCHYDPDASMMMMIEGSKQVRMFSCQDLEKLHPNPLGSRGKTIQSQIDCDALQLDVNYHQFKDATCYHCQLNQGDMLFIPAFWWHQVTSLTDSVSINTFFGDPGESEYICRITKQPVWPSFRYWLLNIVQQNRKFPSFIRTLERLQESLVYLLLKQFHEVAPNDVLEMLVDSIKHYLEIDQLPTFKGGGKHPPPLRVRGLRWR